MEPCADFLYAEPSFLEGAARIMDFGNTLQEYDTSSSGEEADEKAAWMDWAAVGAAIRKSIAAFGEQNARPTG